MLCLCCGLRMERRLPSGRSLEAAVSNSQISIRPQEDDVTRVFQFAFDFVCMGFFLMIVICVCLFCVDVVEKSLLGNIASVEYTMGSWKIKRREFQQNVLNQRKELAKRKFEGSNEEFERLVRKEKRLCRKGMVMRRFTRSIPVNVDFEGNMIADVNTKIWESRILPRIKGCSMTDIGNMVILTVNGGQPGRRHPRMEIHSK